MNCFPYALENSFDFGLVRPSDLFAVGCAFLFVGSRSLFHLVREVRRSLIFSF